MARQLCVLPLSITDKVLTLTVSDPLNVTSIDSVERALSMDFTLCVSPVSQIKLLIDKYYSHVSSSAGSGATDSERGRSAKADGNISIEALVNRIIEEAILHRASDIHIEPEENGLRIRERVDGLLRQVDMLPLQHHASIISRLKILGDLDIAEKRNAQDGRFGYNSGSRSVDLRLSTPNSQG